MVTQALSIPGLIDIGTAGSANGATATLGNGANGLPAGSVVLVAVIEQGVAADGSMTDSQSNTYNIVASTTIASGVNLRAALYKSVLATALPSSSTITFTKNTTGDPAAMSGACIMTPNVNPEASSTLTGTAANLSLTIPSTYGSVVICAVISSQGGVSGAFTNDPRFTTPFSGVTQSPGSNSCQCEGGSILNLGNGPVTYAPSFANAQAGWLMAMYSYRMQVPDDISRMVVDVHKVCFGG